jgi:hyperosmotically inducible protein
MRRKSTSSIEVAQPRCTLNKENAMKTRFPLRIRTGLTVAAVTAATILVACNRNDDRSVGQKTDAAVASVEKTTDQLAADARAAGRDVKDAASNAANKVADKSKDVSITAAVNAELARDSQLSALRINVDTVEGHVTLRGSAPDSASRERASMLANSVSGVVAVDNQLNVSPRG